MVFEAIVLGLIGGIVYMESRLGGQHMLDRPIVIGLLVGLFLGDIKTGLIVGGSLELIWMGLMGIGTTTPPDVVVGATIASGLAIKNDLPLETTLALAIPIAALAQMIFIAIVTLNSTFCHMADKYAEKGNAKGIEKTVFMGAALFFLSKFIFIAVGYAIGSEVIKMLVDAIPKVIIQGLTIATGMIPALGVALLLQMTMTKKYIAFFILGFALVGFLNVSTVAVTVFGLVAAIIYYQFSKNSQTGTEAL